MSGLIYWHIVAALIVFAIALVYLAYRLEVRAEADLDRPDANNGKVLPSCLPLLLSAFCIAIAVSMALWKFVWWLA